MKHLRLTLVASSLALLAAGCGGGSSGGSSTGGGTPAATVAITAANAQTVAAKSYSATQQIGAATQVGSTVRAAGQVSSMADVALAQFNRIKGKQLPATVAGAIANATWNCTVSGTISESYADNNGNGVFDVGDVATMTFNSCVDTAGVTETGGMSMSISRMVPPTSGAVPQVTDMGVTVNFINFQSASTAATLNVNGDMSLGMVMSLDSVTPANNSLSFSISGNSFSSTTTVGTVIDTFAMTGYSMGLTENLTTFKTSNFTINLAADNASLGGVILISTPTPLDDTNSPTMNPNVGVMRITGANGSYVELTAKANGVNIGVVVDDDGAGPNPAQTLADTTWAAL